MGSRSKIIRLDQPHLDLHPIKWIYKMLTERPFLFGSIIVGIILHQSLRFLIPVLIGDLVEFGVEADDGSQIRYYAFLVMIVAMISAIMDLTMSWGNELAANDVEFKTRDLYFRSIQGKNMNFHDESRLGEMMSVAQNDLRSVYTTVAPGLRIFGESIVSIIVVAILLFFESLIIGLTFLVLLPIWLLSLRSYNQKMTPAAVDQQNRFRDLSNLVQENLIATRVVRSFAEESSEIEEFDHLNKIYTNSWEHRGKVTAFFTPMLLTYLLTGIIFILSVLLALNDSIAVFEFKIQTNFGIGGLITVMGLMILFRQPTFFVGTSLELGSLGNAGIAKVQETIGSGNTEDKQTSGIVREIQGSVTFDDVSFSSNGTIILQNISFKVKNGEKIALVGPPGSGKTSLLKLITRFYDNQSGNILIDGIDIRDYNLEKLRKSIGVVEQDVHLFSSRVIENITYAFDDDELTEYKVKDVIERARINEFVATLPDGLDTIVGERGTRLSGGQRQRIALARAFLIDPKILILDDSTSAVDGKTEFEIVSAIEELMENRTSFIVTNRLNMMRKADRIFVLDRGELVGEGNHADLLHSNPIYQRIFQIHRR